MLAQELHTAQLEANTAARAALTGQIEELNLARLAAGVRDGTDIKSPVFHVRAVRWEHGFELHIAGLGVTQSAGLADAGWVARDFIARILDVPLDSFGVFIAPYIAPSDGAE